MKKNILTFCIIALFSVQSFSQTKQETKNFIKDEVSRTRPFDALGSHYRIYFKENISKEELDNRINRTTSIPLETYNNMLLVEDKFYVYANNYLGSKLSMTVLKIIDIRDIKSVSIQDDSGFSGSYWINLYIGGKYFRYSYSYRENNDNISKYTIGTEEKITFNAGEDYETAQRIKKAIIHLGKLYGVIVTDGDNLFR